MKDDVYIIDEDGFKYDTSGLDNVYLQNGYEIVSYGDQKGVNIKDLNGLHKAISSSLINSLQPLTGREFRFLRIELDLSQKALATLFKCEDQTIANYEKSKTAIPMTADMTLRVYYSETMKCKKMAGLIDKLSQIDKKMHETKLEAKNSNGLWDVAKYA